MAPEPKVFVVDDDLAMRQSTGKLLASARFPFATFESGAAFLEEYLPSQPGCLILDMSMPGMSGMELIQCLRSAEAFLPILVVSGTGSIALAVKGMKLGIVDFLEKPVDPDVLLAKVAEALAADAKHREDIASKQAVTKRFEDLTTRELDVVKCIVKGLSNKQIASTLKIAAKTVDNHRTRAMKKTGALNAADLARIAIAAGLT